MTDEAALLASILADPADDTVRLAYADWLDERGEPGDAERAEFIRVQVELPRVPACGTAWKVGHPKGPVGCRCCELRRRERVLLATHWREWSHLQAGYVSASYPTAVGASSPDADVDGVTYHFSRGFVSAVQVTAAAFLGGPCPECEGDGKSTETVCPTCMAGRPRTRDGGAYTVCCRAEPYYLDCKACNGRGRTEGIAAELFRRHPIERVTLTDKRPWSDVPDGGRDYGWWLETEGRILADGANDPGNLPGGLFNLIWMANPANRRSDESNRWVVWDEPGIAEEELSAAIVLRGRALAGLGGPSGCRA